MTAILNPAPARSDLNTEMFLYTDILCPNETEVTMFALVHKNENKHTITLQNNFTAMKKFKCHQCSADIKWRIFISFIPTRICNKTLQAELLTGEKVETVEEAKSVLPVLLSRGCKTVIITLGDKGAVFASREEPTPVHVPAPSVKATDTTVSTLKSFCRIT